MKDGEVVIPTDDATDRTWPKWTVTVYFEQNLRVRWGVPARHSDAKMRYKMVQASKRVRNV